MGDKAVRHGQVTSCTGIRRSREGNGGGGGGDEVAVSLRVLAVRVEY